jgi:hypothetical protein
MFSVAQFKEYSRRKERMYTRVVTVHVQPGKMDEFLRRLRDLAPGARARRGFHEAPFLTDAHTGTVLGITMPDQEGQLEALIAEGDMVVGRWTLRGTHTGGPFLGLAPTGARLPVRLIE